MQLYQLTHSQHGLHWIELWILFEIRTKAFTPPTTDQPYGPSHDPRAPPTLQQTLNVFKKIAKCFIKTLPPAHEGRKMMNTQPAPSTRLANLLISNAGAIGYMPTTTEGERDEIQKKILQLRRSNHPNVLTAIKSGDYTAKRVTIQMKQNLPWKRQPRLDHDDNATHNDKHHNDPPIRPYVRHPPRPGMKAIKKMGYTLPSKTEAEGYAIMCPRKGCGYVTYRETKPIIPPPPYQRRQIANILCNNCKDIRGIRHSYFIASEGQCATCHYAVHICRCHCDSFNKTTTYRLPAMLHSLGAQKPIPTEGSLPLTIDPHYTTPTTTS